MCLGVPGRVVRIDDNVAVVDFWGVHREVRLDIVGEPVGAGDYVLNHVGFAIRRIPDTEVAATMALYDELLAAVEREDLLAQDLRGELNAAANGANADGAARVGAAGYDHGDDPTDGTDDGTGGPRTARATKRGTQR